MKFRHPKHSQRVRVEVIPLIDIMIFLLAIMMMVNLRMIRVSSIKVKLPSAQTATAENKRDFTSLSVKANGDIYLDETQVSVDQLGVELLKLRAAKPDVRILIQGDATSLHGEMMRVLDVIRTSGISRVAFQTQKVESKSSIIGNP